MKMWIASLAILLFALPVVGADYYVSTEGNDDTGNGSIDNPWRTPAYGASQLTSAGDTLYIRAGTYNVTGATWNTSTIYPRANGTSAARITIRNYPDETVTLDGGSAPTNGIIGIGGYDYITIKGLIIKGQVKLMYGDHAILEDCDVSVGGDSYTGDTGFGDVIFLAETTGSIIRNCRIHDNTVQREDRLNSPLIMEYSTTDLTIEYCDIYNSVGCGIRFKDNPENVTVRYCHIYGNYYSGIAGPSQSQGYDMYVYQNVIRGNNTNSGDEHYPEHGGVRINVYIDRSYIYNNTFYDNGFSDLTVINTTGVDNINFFNNISYLPNTRHIALQYTVTPAVLDYSDYNCFYNDQDYESQNSLITSLTAWGSATSLDANSVTSDPGFINASGNWNLPTDFKRASYSADGRGGDYPSVIGAYVTGNEVIGYTPSGTATIRASGTAGWR